MERKHLNIIPERKMCDVSIASPSVLLVPSTDGTQSISFWSDIWKCKKLAHDSFRVYYYVILFSTQECGSTFIDKAALNRHISVHHSGAPSQKCMHCDKSFYHRAGLLSHIRTVHQMDKSFYCSKCSRAFSSGTTSSSLSCLMPKICYPKNLFQTIF